MYKLKPHAIKEYEPARNMKHYIEMLADRGEKVVYRFYKGKEIGEMLYGILAKRIKALAASLKELGLENGDKIAIIGETSHMWTTSYAAIIGNGCVAVPLDKELDFDVIKGFLEISEAKAVIYSAAFNDKFEELMVKESGVKYFIAMNPKAPSDKVKDFEMLVMNGMASTDYEMPDTEDINRLATMLFTSGTTGTSKCVMLSEKNVFAAINSACDTVDFYERDTIVSVLPLHHTYELACMFAAMNIGMTVCLNDSIRNVSRNLNVFKPTGLVLVPLFVNTMYKKIFTEAQKKGSLGKLNFGLKIAPLLSMKMRRKLFRDVINGFGGRLEKIICGGAALNPDMVKVFEKLGIRVYEGYGITECSPLIAVNPYTNPKLCSVGPAVTCCETKIDETEKDEKGNSIGEILVKGDNVMLGYYNNDEENRKVFTEDGYFRTGDIGYMDKDGYIYITGRLKSVIVLENGKNVFPEEIEEYLERIDYIAESVVVGRKNDDGEVILTAVVFPAYDKYPDLYADELEVKIKEEINQLNKHVSPFKKIRDVEFRHEEFEKTTSRKIKRHLVK